jgi:ABC-type antimicrobial peptide transport system permease subunit
MSLLRDDFERRVRGSRIAGTVASGIGLSTLMLACLGIFGVVSYGVSLRTKEIGIRCALGACPAMVVRALLTQVAKTAGAGVAVGLIAAVPAAIALSGDPFHLDPLDPGVFVAALIIFATAAMSAAVWPALRGVRRDPVDALRHS